MFRLYLIYAFLTLGAFVWLQASGYTVFAADRTVSGGPPGGSRLYHK